MRGTAAAAKADGAEGKEEDAEVDEIDEGFKAVVVKARSCALAVEKSLAAWPSILKMGWSEEVFASKVIKEEEQSEDCRTDKCQSTGPAIRGDGVRRSKVTVAVAAVTSSWRGSVIRLSPCEEPDQPKNKKQSTGAIDDRLEAENGTIRGTARDQYSTIDGSSQVVRGAPEQPGVVTASQPARGGGCELEPRPKEGK